jgi:hypothetical protein
MRLRDELVGLSAGISGLEPLHEAHLTTLAARVADRFVVDPAAPWWWSRLHPDRSVQTHSYHDADAWDVLRSLLPPRAQYVLAATDHDPRPSRAFRGSPTRLAALVSDAPLFEYFITDDDASFVVFDTHRNTLVAVS